MQYGNSYLTEFGFDYYKVKMVCAPKGNTTIVPIKGLRSRPCSLHQDHPRRLDLARQSGCPQAAQPVAQFQG
jgi:hypothetical protein